MSIVNLGCPFPENINPLSPNGFMLLINELPGLTYFCQQASIPSVSLPAASQMTPFVAIPQKGEQLNYETLTVQFLVDSQLANYRAINDWMTDGYPGYFPEKPDKIFSDGFLHVLGSSNETVATIQFVDLTPISLEGLTFASTNTDVQYLVGSVTFEYTYYKFV